MFVLLASALVVLPFADEIIGKFQFDRLCVDAGEANIHATIPVGEELYLPNGRWRLASGSPPLPLEEFKRVRAIYDSFVRWDSTQVARTAEVIPISEVQTRIYDRKTGDLLATFRSYGTTGGWVSRRFEKPVLVRDQCMPPALHLVDQRILPFRSGSRKSK